MHAQMHLALKHRNCTHTFAPPHPNNELRLTAWIRYRFLGDSTSISAATRPLPEPLHRQTTNKYPATILPKWLPIDCTATRFLRRKRAVLLATLGFHQVLSCRLSMSMATFFLMLVVYTRLPRMPSTKACCFQRECRSDGRTQQAVRVDIFRAKKY